MKDDDRERWYGAMGELYCRDQEEANAELSEEEALDKFCLCAKEFLKQTSGLKLEGGPVTRVAREAWNAVLIGISKQERYPRK